MRSFAADFDKNYGKKFISFVFFQEYILSSLIYIGITSAQFIIIPASVGAQETAVMNVLSNDAHKFRDSVLLDLKNLMKKEKGLFIESTSDETKLLLLGSDARDVEEIDDFLMRAGFNKLKLISSQKYNGYDYLYRSYTKLDQSSFGNIAFIIDVRTKNNDNKIKANNLSCYFRASSL